MKRRVWWQVHGGGENRRSTATKRMAGQKDIWRSQQAEARWKCPSTRPSKGFFVSDNLLPSFVNSFWYSLSAVIMPFQSSHIVSGSNRKPESIQAVETWRKFYGKSARRGGLWWMTNIPALTESVTDRRCSAVGGMQQRSRNVNRNEATSSPLFIISHFPFEPYLRGKRWTPH